MHLLNASTEKLEFFQEDNIPPYTILSHVWGEEEVSFQCIQDDHAKAKSMKGYSKIENTCAIAAKDGWNYVWIDTCCIHKESSSELSEAINSMYLWYEKSWVCYTYLGDVPSEDDPKEHLSSFRRSRWFGRGWTLQELLAPRSVIFYGQDWIELGSKASLQEEISAVTGIPSKVLVVETLESNISIAERMSWASKRMTTREEDRAYSLMGLFGVYMPTIYGEGRNAFIRLQQEIIKQSDDQTIFAWKNDGTPRTGLLAHSPTDFKFCDNIVKGDEDDRVSDYSMTNRGLRMQLPLRAAVGKDPDVFLAALNCKRRNDPLWLAVYLKRHKDGRYVRINPGIYEQVDWRNIVDPSSVIVKHAPAPVVHSAWPQVPATCIVTATIPPEHGFVVKDWYPSYAWVDKGHEWLLEGTDSVSRALLRFENKTTGEKFALIFGTHDSSFWLDVVTNLGNESAMELVYSYGNIGKGKMSKHLDRMSATLRDGSRVFAFM
jgi:hypothetical protein